MALPGMNAESALYRTTNSYSTGGARATSTELAGVVPQFCLSSPCVRIGGRYCVTLPFFGRRCVNLPYFGSWQLRCCTGWWPPISCSVRSCAA